MHRTTPTTRDFGLAMVNPPSVADNTGLYEIVAEAIVRQPDHLGELVELMESVRNAGVDLTEHWDCLTAELMLLEMQ